VNVGPAFAAGFGDGVSPAARTTTELMTATGAVTRDDAVDGVHAVCGVSSTGHGPGSYRNHPNRPRISASE
jgi:hypothetical protein